MCTISPKLYNKITEMVQENHPTISLTGLKTLAKQLQWRLWLSLTR